MCCASSHAKREIELEWIWTVRLMNWTFGMDTWNGPNAHSGKKWNNKESSNAIEVAPMEMPLEGTLRDI